MGKSSHEALTDRERTILNLIADGYSNSDIADHLHFSLNTVKWYLKQIYGKLAVVSRTQALAKARALGYLTETVTPAEMHGIYIPTPFTPFIEGQKELDELSTRLDDPTTHLVTILGPGRGDKTLDYYHYAQQIAEGAQANVATLFNLATLSCVWVELGDFAQAHEMARRSLEMNREHQYVDAVIMVMVGMGLAEVRKGHPDNGLKTRAILQHHPQLGGTSRPIVERLVRKIANDLPKPQADTINNQAKAHQLSTPQVESDFIIDAHLIDQLILGLDKVFT